MGGRRPFLLAVMALVVMPAAHVSAFIATGSLPRLPYLAPRGGAARASSLALQAKTFSPNDFGVNIAGCVQRESSLLTTYWSESTLSS